MKVCRLHFFSKAYVGLMCTSVDLATHDIKVGGPGYVVTERRSGKSYLVHAASCTAELEKDDEVQPEVPAARRKGAQVPA